MIPELGNMALILAFCLSIAQFIIPLYGSFTGRIRWMQAARFIASGQFFFVFCAFLILAYCFIINDFSVAYVAEHSNTHLPFFYRIAAIWGAHEGSLLLWVLVLNIWTVAVCYFSQNVSLVTMARVISILGFISIGFLLFMLATSNPFLRLLPNIPLQGNDLNPILQDPGLIIHPPMLYMGYVGFSVAFAFAIAALISGKLDAAWIRWTRPWTMAAWVFLTFGIVLGSWWAYRELGWGGWWFWDPVENASFMPWLVGTALIHSLAVSEKRNILKSWTILLAIFAFSLSLIGTFLVRSGVLTSVHAFAVDPKRGLYILIYLAVIVGGSLTLYAWRAGATKATGRFEFVSRETFLLSNNVLLTVAAITVLLGTLYPLVLDALHLGKISVGPPYFNLVFSVLMIPLLFLLALAPLTRWKRFEINLLLKKTWISFIICIILAIVLPWFFTRQLSFIIVLGLLLAFWIILISLQDFLANVFHRSSIKKGLTQFSASYYAMLIAHIGVAITVIGIVLTSYYSVGRVVRLAPGQSAKVANYTFKLLGMRDISGPNYGGYAADIAVFNIGEKTPSHILEAQRRIYRAQNIAKTRADVSANLFRDLYVSLGEGFNDGSWALRIYDKPFVRWIWYGGFLMMFGGVLAIYDRRYRFKRWK